MSMTREETISILEESKRQNEIMRDNPTTFWASYQMADGVKNSEKRIAALDLALAALRGPTREQVERMRGEWIIEDAGKGGRRKKCSLCDTPISGWWGRDRFCAECGAPVTDEAVDMMLKRLRVLTNDN